MDRSIKYVYLTLTKNEFPTFPSLISFMVWELKKGMGISVLVFKDFGIGQLYENIGTVSVL